MLSNPLFPFDVQPAPEVAVGAGSVLVGVLPVGVSEGAGVEEGNSAVPTGVGVAVLVGGWVGVRVGVRVAVGGSGVAVFVEVRVGVGVRVGVADGGIVSASVAVAVEVEVCVGEAVLEWVGEGVEEGVALPIEIEVAVGSRVGVRDSTPRPGADVGPYAGLWDVEVALSEAEESVGSRSQSSANCRRKSRSNAGKSIWNMASLATTRPKNVRPHTTGVSNRPVSSERRQEVRRRRTPFLGLVGTSMVGFAGQSA